MCLVWSMTYGSQMQWAMIEEPLAEVEVDESDFKKTHHVPKYNGHCLCKPAGQSFCEKSGPAGKQRVQILGTVALAAWSSSLSIFMLAVACCTITPDRGSTPPIHLRDLIFLELATTT